MLNKDLTVFKSVERWLRDLKFEKTGSRYTEALFLWVLRSFCDFAGEDPDALVAACKRGGVDSVSEKIKRYAISDGSRAKNTVSNYTCVLKSFFAHNGIALPIRSVQRWVKYEDRAITSEELCTLLKVADLRAKVEIAVLVQSGLRVGTRAMLNYSHVRKELEAREVPIRIHVSSEMAKGRVRSFLTHSLGPSPWSC